MPKSDTDLMSILKYGPVPSNVGKWWNMPYDSQVVADEFEKRSKNNPDYTADKHLAEHTRLRKMQTDRWDEEAKALSLKAKEDFKQRKREEEWAKYVEVNKAEIDGWSQSKKDHMLIKLLKAERKRQVAAKRYYYKNKKNRDKKKNKMNEYYQNNRDDILVQRKKDYEQDPEKFKKRYAEYYEKNQDVICDKQSRRYYHEEYEPEKMYDDD